MSMEMLDDPLTATGVRAGDLLAGKYRIERLLGAGGMGVVVAAQHLQLDHWVAIKFLLPEALRNPEAVARFAREARAAVKIKSEHVARVIDVGTLDSGAPYMVMEYLEGVDLAARVRERGPLGLEEAVDFVLQACEALAVAHALGIVHRDLKPSNLFCVRHPDGLESIKVLDFGISKVTNPGGASSDAQMTRTHSVFGSPLYMSPEQMLSARDVDARTDLWALGAILYELLAGKSPFEGETLPEVYARISTQPPVPLLNHRPDTPTGLQQVVLKCLEKDRARRYSNVAELALALSPFAPRRSRVAVERISRVIQTAGLSGEPLVPPPSSESPRTPGVEQTKASWGQTTPAAGRSLKLRAVMVGAFGVAVAIGVAIWREVVTVPPTTPATSAMLGSSSVTRPSVAVDPTAGSPPAVVPAVSEPLPSASASTPRPRLRGFSQPRFAPPKVASAVAAPPAKPPTANPARPATASPPDSDWLRRQY
jgi:serine/threonine protein kinase